MEVAVARKTYSHPAASSRFGGFRPESERSVRSMRVEMNPVLEEMKHIWRTHNRFEFFYTGKHYSEIFRRIKGMEYSARDVEAFSNVLEGFQNDFDFPLKVGLFLSALINNCAAEEFVIHTAHLPPIDGLGYRNRKNILVKGNAGDDLGEKMEGGTMTVEGHAGSCAGNKMRNGTIIVEGDIGCNTGFRMVGGDITVRGDAGYGFGRMLIGGVIVLEGNAGLGVGHEMKGGIITVGGNAGDDVGASMWSGEIHLLGDSFGLSPHLHGGKIFHNSDLILSK